MQWKDVTTYSRGERGVKEPTAFELDMGGGFRIWISCGHLYYPGEWVMKCHALGQTEPKKLRAQNFVEGAREAKSVAASMANAKAQKFLKISEALTAQEQSQ